MDDAALPPELGDDAFLPPPIVRADPAGFCNAALEQARPFAPEVAARITRFSAVLGLGDTEVHCLFESGPDSPVIVAFDLRCDDPHQPACIAPLSISDGDEGWVEPAYASAAQTERSGVRVDRLVMPNESQE